MKRIFRKKIVISFVILLCVAAGAYFYFSSAKKTLVVFKLGELAKRDICLQIDATGTLEPEDIIDVGARVSGEILSFGKDLSGKTVDYASKVKQGDMIALIDDEIPRSDLREAEARLAASKASKNKAEAGLLVAEAALKKADRDWKRAERLGVSDVLSQASYDSFLSAYEQAKAQVESAKAQIIQADAEIVQSEAGVSTAKRNLGYCVIKAPVDGIIIDRKVNVGQTVVSSMNASSLFLIAKNLEKMEIWASVNEADIGSIKIGQNVTFTVDAFPNLDFKGSVGKIRMNATMSQNVVSYIVEVLIDNPDGILLPYLTANLKFEIESKKSVWSVPNAALRFRPDESLIAENLEIPKGKKIWLRNADNKLSPLQIKTGLSDGVFTEIIAENLSESANVVLGLETSLSAPQAAGSNPFTPTPPRFRGSRQNQPSQGAK